MRSTTIFICFLFLLAAIALQAQGITIYEDDFETGQLDPARWMARPSLEGAAGIVDPADGDGLYGSWGVRLGKSADSESFTTNALDLKINLANRQGVKLSFWIYDNQDETHEEDGVYFSDGANFIKVVDFHPNNWCDYRYGQFPPIDVSQLAADNGLVLNSQFVIRFQQHDDDDFFGNPDGFYLDDIRVYSQEPVYLSLSEPFCEDFETGRLSDSWAWRSARKTSALASIPDKPSNIVGVYSGNGYNSEYAVVMGKDCDDGFSANALDLHLNLEGLTEVEMIFLIYDIQDETQADDGIYFSDDGGQNFVKVLDFQPADWCDYQYGQYPPLDVDELAAAAELALTSRFVIRFQQYDDSDFYGNPDGFRLDDVCVYVPDRAYFPVSPSNPFCDDFETGRLGSAWAWRPADLTNTLAEYPSRPSNIVGVFDGNGYNSPYAVVMGKGCDDGFATNALDLHLDLEGLTEVEMIFLIYDIQDETQADDGIYFSDDGGANFVKVWDFRPGDWCDYQYGQHPPLDVDQLASEHELQLSSQFIIRFQQHDDSDFYGNPDGLQLDDVCVYVPGRVCAPVPFFDDFETGHLGNAWSWSLADQTALPAQNVTLPSNIVGVFNGAGNNSEYGAVLGKSCDDGFATNALDLCLNLLGASGVTLSFDIYHHAEETHIQDGIYFSDDGGEGFVKVYNFDYNAFPPYQYTHSPVLDIESLASANGLSLSSRFAIRFQQHDDSDFYGNPDGIYLDNINVTGMITGTSEAVAQAQISAFPNPAQDWANIQGLPAGPEPFAYRLLNLQGQAVSAGWLPADSPKVSLSGLPEGLFLLELRRAEEVYYLKLIKRQ